jgi:dolichol-phosphate mannosyltransferase
MEAVQKEVRFPGEQGASSLGLLPVPSGSYRIPVLNEQNYFRGADVACENSSESSSVYLSLILPTYKERINVIGMVAILTMLLDEALPGAYEIIVVDDDSPDQTWEVALRLMAHYPALRVMRRTGVKGLATAVVRGWQAARGEVLGVIDADMQQSPEVVLQLLDKIRSGGDLVIASRHVEGGGVSNWNLFRRGLSRGSQLLGLLVLPEIVGQVSDPMSGYFLVCRQAIANRTLRPSGSKILLEVLSQGDVHQIEEVGYVFHEREERQAIVVQKNIEFIKHLLRLRLRVSKIKSIWQRRKSFPVTRFVQFGTVGLAGILLNTLLLSTFQGQLGLGVLASTLIAAELVILGEFTWNDIWTFGDIARQQRQWNQFVKRFMKFNIVCVMGLMIRAIILALLSGGLSFNIYAANLLAISALLLWNFWISLKLSWRVTAVD